jgi:PAS domain S-box-containing protein
LNVPAFALSDRLNMIKGRLATMKWMSLPKIVALLSVLLTIVLIIYSKSNSEQLLRVEFSDRVHESEDRIVGRMKVYEELLRGVQGLLLASPKIKRSQFNDYVASLQLPNYYPGIQGIGYAVVVTESQKVAYEARLRAEGFPTFGIRPPDKRSFYTSIEFIAPFSDRNLRAFGYDMFSESTRRSAMERARDTGEAVLSGKVKLVQETHEKVQAGALLYLPLYKHPQSSSNFAVRGGAIRAWVYQAFRLGDLMEVLAPKFESGIQLDVHDGEFLSDETLLFSNTTDEVRHASADAALKVVKHVRIANHTWTLVYRAQRNFGSENPLQNAAYVGVLGIAISMLLTWITWLLATGRDRAQKLASEMTHELRQSESNFRLLLDSAAEGIYGLDMDGNCTFCNAACVRMLGYESSESLIGKNMHRVIHHSHANGDLMPEESCKLFKSFHDRVNVHVDDEVFWKSDDKSFPVEYWAHPQCSEDKVLGSVVTFVDISERLKAIETLRSHDELLEQVISGARAGVWDWNIQTGEVRFNQRWAEIVGYSLDELSPTTIATWEKLSHPEDFARSAELLQKHFSDGATYDIECRMKHKDGHWVWVHDRGKLVERDLHGKPIRMVGTHMDITNRKNVVAALQESEKNFRTFFESLSDMVFVVDLNGKILHVNESVSKTLGYSCDEARGMDLSDFNMLKDRDESRDVFSKLAIGTRISSSFPLLSKERGCVPAETRMWHGNWNGQACVFGVSKDLSDQQAAIDLFENLFESNPASMAVSTLPNRRFSNVNSAFLHTLGYSSDELIGKTPEELGLFANPEQAAELANQLRLHGEIRNLHLSVKTKSGEILDGLFSGTQINRQNQLAFLTVMIDITVSKNAERQIKDLSQKLQLAYRSAKIGMWEYWPQQGRLIWDDQMYDLYGVEKSPGQQDVALWSSAIHPEDSSATQRTLEDALSGSCEFDPEFRVLTPSGETRYIKASAKISRDEHGVASYMVGLNLDITSLKEAENFAKKASQHKSEFLAKMSHEIRTPLNGIVTMAKLIMETALGDKQREEMEVVLSCAETLQGLIDDILDFSKIEAGKMSLEPRSICLAELLERSVRSFGEAASQKGLELTTFVDPRLPKILMGDPIRIRQIVTNFVGNAIKFTAAGKVTVSALLESQDSASADVLVSVIDTGIGVSKVQMESLFSSFVQADSSISRRFGGTGLGLSISKQLAEMMGGHVGAESQEGVGSRFWFTLKMPYSSEEICNESLSNEQKERRVNGEAASYAAARVLVAEDTVTNQIVIRAVLEEFGIAPHIVSNGQDALSALAAAPYDLVLMDVHMPVMDGMTASRALRGTSYVQNAKVPIVALTASVSIEERQRYHEAGMDDVLGKPVDFHQFAAVLEKWLGSKSLAQNRAENVEPFASDKADTKDYKNFDRAYIFNKKMFIEGLLDNVDLAHRVVKKFFDEGRQHYADLEKALLENEHQLIRAHAHALKGLSGVVASKAVQHAAAALESAARHGEEAHFSELSANLRASWTRLEDELSKWDQDE